MSHPRFLPAFRGTRALASLCVLGSSLLLSGVLLYGIPGLGTSNTQPPLRIPSNVAWTHETIAEASHGDPVRGFVIASRCARCHGQEGFSAIAAIPNLAGLQRLAIWKQLKDFRDRKRKSAIMNAVAAELEVKDYADLAAYYSILPTSADSGDTRAFPDLQSATSPTIAAARLVTLGDGARGIPPCQVCHGPSGHQLGTPELATQNSLYIQQQLEDFARSDRSNDINMPMRSIAGMLTDQEKQSIADYYGHGFGGLPASPLGTSH